MNDEEIIAEANIEARKLKSTIAKQWTDVKTFSPENNPVSVFMAGSPGAGKTEAAKNLIKLIGGDRPIIHLDPDRIRVEFSNYNGDNAELFQLAVSSILNRMHDYVLKNSQSFILDSTLSNFDKAVENIEHSLKKERQRNVYIIYVYQDPLQAWRFVQKRRGVEGRKVPKDAFIKSYFSARETVNKLVDKYGDIISFELIVKNIDAKNQAYFKGFQSIDDFVPERYSEEELRRLL